MVGVSGLALAYEFAKSACSVEIFERGAELGGLAAGFDVIPGVRLERFYHHIFQTDSDFIELARELGISDQIMWRPARVGFFLDGDIHRLSTPVDVLRFRPLKLWDRIALGWTMFELRERRSAKPFEGLTVEEWFHRRAASGVYRRIWGPMLEAKWGPDRDNLSAAWLWQKVRARGNSRRGLHEELGYPIGGFGQLARALANRIEGMGGKIRLGTVVKRITIETGPVAGIETDNETHQFDAVVSTLPVANLAHLVDDVPKEAKEELSRVPYRGVVCHVMVMDRPLSDIYWLNIADRTIPLGGIVEHTNFVPPQHYDGRHIVYLFNYLSQDAPELTLSEEAFVSHHFPHVERIFPHFRPDHVESRFVFRTRVATPIYKHPYRPPPLEPVPGLWLADTSRIFPMDRGTSECIRLARFVSARVLGRAAAEPAPV